MRVFVVGATGFLGQAITTHLVARGDRVIALCRNPARAAAQLPRGVEILEGEPASSGDAPPWGARLAECDAVLNLGGEPVIGRWTEAKRAAIRRSRVDATQRLVTEMLRSSKTMTLVNASAIGYYGDSDQPLDEGAPRGSGFLAEVCGDWEAAALAATPRHRVVCLRIGVVLGRGGGALAQMLPAFRAFVGGPVGSGKQWVSFIHLDDLVRLVLAALDDARYAGPINATAPHPVTMKQLASAIGRALGRPSWLPAPGLALRALFGEAASVLLGGQRVLPRRAEELGFVFEAPTVEEALRRSL